MPTGFLSPLGDDIVVVGTATPTDPSLIDVTLPSGGVLLVWVRDRWCAPNAWDPVPAQADVPRLSVAGREGVVVDRQDYVTVMGLRVPPLSGSSETAVLARRDCSLSIRVTLSAGDDAPPGWAAPPEHSTERIFSNRNDVAVYLTFHPSEPGFLVVATRYGTHLYPGASLLEVIPDDERPVSFVVASADLAGNLGTALRFDDPTAAGVEAPRPAFDFSILDVVGPSAPAKP